MQMRHETRKCYKDKCHDIGKCYVTVIDYLLKPIIPPFSVFPPGTRRDMH